MSWAGPVATARPARARLFCREEDLGLRRFFSGGVVDRDTIARVAGLLAAARRPVDPAAVVEESAISRTRLSTRAPARGRRRR